MLETPHVIVAAAIATKISNPIISLPLAFASHFVLDMTPHWNPHLTTNSKKTGSVSKIDKIIVTADSTTALISGVYIAYQTFPNIVSFITIIIACFLSVLPDVIEAPYYFLGMRSKLIKRWINFQKSIQANASPVVGITTQIITIIASIWWIFN